MWNPVSLKKERSNLPCFEKKTKFYFVVSKCFQFVNNTRNLIFILFAKKNWESYFLLSSNKLVCIKRSSFSWLTLFRVGLFGTAHRWGGGGGGKKAPLPQTCHIYPTMIKLCTVIPYLKEDPKNIWITWHTSWILLTSAFFARNQ